MLESEELRDAAKRLLEKSGNRPGSLRGLWPEMTALGWLGLGIPEERGGLGQPFSALSILYRELGGVLAPEPFAVNSMCLQALASLCTDNDPAAALIQKVLAGEALLAAISTLPGAVTCRNGCLRGRAAHVLNAGEATHLLVPLNHEVAAIFIVALPNRWVSITHTPTWDHTRRLYEVVFQDAPLDEGTVLRGEGVVDATERMEAHFDLALASDAVGGCDAIFDKTVDYMKIRRQFDRPIGSFQALKHRVADLKTSLEASRALLGTACRSFAEQRGDWRSMASCIRLYAGSVYRSVSEDAVQLHGGIGFTWDHDCHLFLKRARLNDVLHGTPEQRKDRLAPALFGAANMR